ncbi:hypothetical protein [Vibrio phage XZ1]|uniref:Uncharacterized protein n=1 Tax=Vibrio phage ValKK3 TaxID=1610855 RepID=A0A0D4DBE2_9CAUD|nr:hypothetical protein AVU32_gp354 [Vibrio phage ValKK3]AJT61195.1 hypothetical protein [Vibrio phage ValKK3]ALP47682.1 hypothetical protein phiST2_0158 [Vibrio phage phi-ST2]QBX06178.1 hypothetical protein Va3_225 [Vibrio phage Va3]UOL51236.1 hypothetical protein [Vibrio phage XZ1]
MKENQQLKVRCSIQIAEQLQQLPEFRDMSVTKIFHTLSTNYLNKSAFQHIGAINGKNRNHHSYEER